MYDELKNIFKHGSVYTIGIVLSKIVSFIMIPLYTNLLKPEEYGTLELLTVSVDIITTVMGFGLMAAMMRFYFKSGESSERNQVISTTLIGSAGIMGVTSALCIVFAVPISQLVFHNSQNAVYLRIMFTTMFISSMIEIPLAYTRILQKSVKFVTISLVRLAIQLGLNIFFLVFLHKGVIGVLYSSLITSIIMGVYLILTTSFSTGLRFNKRLFMSMITYGLPLIIADISAFVLTFSDRFFLNYYTNLSDVGIYSLAYKFGMLLSMVFIAPFTQIWTARMFDIYNRADAKEVISKVLTLFLLGALAINLGISILTKDVLRLISHPDYWSAYKLVPVISLAYVLNGIIYVISVSIYAQGRTKLAALAMTIAIAVNISSNFILIPQWGKAGAAYATIISYLVRVVLMYYFSQALFKIRYDWGKIFQIAGVSFILIIVSHYITFDNIFLSLWLNIMLMALFPFIIYMIGIFNQKEKEFIRACIKNPLKIREYLGGGLG